MNAIEAKNYALRMEHLLGDLCLKIDRKDRVVVADDIQYDLAGGIARNSDILECYCGDPEFVGWLRTFEGLANSGKKASEVQVTSFLEALPEIVRRNR